MNGSKQTASNCDVNPASCVMETMNRRVDTDASGLVEPLGFAQNVDAMILTRAQRSEV